MDSAAMMFANELRKRLDEVENLRIQIDADWRRIQQTAQERCQSQNASIKKDLADYCASQSAVMKAKLTDIKKILPRHTRSSSGSIHHLCSIPMEENQRAIGILFQEIGKLCQELNEIDFNEADPPVAFFTDAQKQTVICRNKYTGSPATFSANRSDRLYTPILDKLEGLVQEAENRIDAVAQQFQNIFNMTDISSKGSAAARDLLNKYRTSKEAEFQERVNQLLNTEDKIINSAFFQKMEEAGKKYEPNYKHGSTEFTPYLAIGTEDIVYSEQFQQDLPYINQSPLLKQHVADGVVRTPKVLDLTKNGNILLDRDSDDGKLSEQTIAFIHQYIQSFLLTQPSCRVNLCLVDFNDQCKFNVYAPLCELNSNLLCDGIIRNEKDINSVIANMEKLMFDIGDNKLSTNGVENIFQLNAISAESPQSMHLMVLLDFPEKYSVDTITHIDKIVSNGNDRGIYTLIVRNTDQEADFGFKQNAYDSAIASIEKNSIRLYETDAGFILGHKRYFTPLKTLPISKFSSNVFPILKQNAEKQNNKSIPMADMFKTSDQYDRANTDPLLSSELLEIPIGKNGSKVQSLQFSNGTKSVHSLVIGGTGSGKSNLLHTIILSACYRYSPKELQIYLIDFKGGVEFKCYEGNKVIEDQVPHIALTGLTSEPEDGLAILTNIRTILRERENLFRRNNKPDLREYNKSVNKEDQLPQVLVIIDEVQELFSNDRLVHPALTIMGELFKKGRAFGIHILWASQTVPKDGSGGNFKDKVLSQVGSRICLKLNDPDEAATIGIEPDKVRALNRPEVGLAIFKDNTNSSEFRIAYGKEDILGYIHQINNKWAEECRRWKNRKPLFVVGDDEIPDATIGAEKYQLSAPRMSLPKSGEEYDLSLGQDYISGNPFRIPMAIRGSKENCWIAGKDICALRNVIGFAMLSAALENYTNSDLQQKEKRIYYYNGELGNKDRDALYCVLPDKLSDMTVKMEDPESFANAMIQLYRLRKERYARMSAVHDPIFVFIHKMQILGELFEDEQKYNVSNNPMSNGFTGSGSATIGSSADDVFAGTPIPSGFTSLGNSAVGSGAFTTSMGGSGAGNDVRMTMRDIVKELMNRGPDVGIHFVCTVNDPCAIPRLRNEFKDFSYKIVLAGVPGDAVSQMTDCYLSRDKAPVKDGVAFCYCGDTMAKFKLYQYEPYEHAQWLDSLLDTYR